MDPINWITIGFSGCCCVAFFIAAFAILTLLMRPPRPAGKAMDGLPPPPTHGVSTRASLTRLEQEAARRRPKPDEPK
jgi:hypothetical protein